jgi:hypothetical protein
MKKIVLFVLLNFLNVFGKAQTFSCNQSTATITSTFYPNTTSSYTTYVDTFLETIYLCGPNTVVYDTAFNLGHFNCKAVLQNASSTYIFYSPSGCPSPKMIYLKDNSTLIIKPNTTANSTYIYKEPLATIINQSTATFNITNCPSISFPVVNCAVGIDELVRDKNSLRIFPNPVSRLLYIETEQIEPENSEIEIRNILGQTVLKQFYSNAIDVSRFERGYYNLKIATSNNFIYHSKFVKE